MDNYISGEWKAEHFETYSQVVSYGAHERHEGCTGNLIVVNKIIGNPDVRKAIGELIARAPSMLALLEKALPIIENEAELREASMVRHGEDKCVTSYWSEMRQLANTIRAEISKAKGDTVIDAELCLHGFGFVEYCEDCNQKEIKAKWREKEDSHG